MQIRIKCVKLFTSSVSSPEVGLGPPNPPNPSNGQMMGIEGFLVPDTPSGLDTELVDSFIGFRIICAGYFPKLNIKNVPETKNKTILLTFCPPQIGIFSAKF